MILTRAAHLERRQQDGQVERTRVAGEPLELRLVVGRSCEVASGKVLARWWLLTNLPTGQAPAAEIVKWYTRRWQTRELLQTA